MLTLLDLNGSRVSLLPTASENLRFYVMWELKICFFVFFFPHAIGTIFHGNFQITSKSHGILILSGFFFFDILGHSPIHASIPKDFRKMAKSQSNIFSSTGQWDFLDICLQSVNHLKIPNSLLTALLE